MGFASYFLIVWDFVRYAREKGIPASARGSACGALVSYLLHLSNVCPLKYDLLFERFLDPSRSEAPDIDIDLCQERRYEVIEYVRKKYGDANVAQIGTFGTSKTKAAIKDVGRALNIPLARVEQINKLVPARLNITLDEAFKEEPALRRMADEDPEVERLLDFARRLEGTNRNVGTHAAGVVIADRPLEELVPLQKIPNKDKAKEVVTTQWEMGDIEKAGLLKMDFLGLRNLTTTAAAVRLINQRHPEAPIDLDQSPSGRSQDLRALAARRDQGGLPARIVRHPRPLDQDEARPVRRHHRHQCPLSPGPVERRHGRRICRCQERPQAGLLPASRSRRRCSKKPTA